MEQLVKIQEIKAATGNGRTKIIEDEKAGLLPPWVKLGPRFNVMPKTELSVVLAARVAGRSEDEIRELVRVMAAKRGEKLAALLSAIQ